MEKKSYRHTRKGHRDAARSCSLRAVFQWRLPAEGRHTLCVHVLNAIDCGKMGTSVDSERAISHGNQNLKADEVDPRSRVPVVNGPSLTCFAFRACRCCRRVVQFLARNMIHAFRSLHTLTYWYESPRPTFRRQQ